MSLIEKFNSLVNPTLTSLPSTINIDEIPTVKNAEEIGKLLKENFSLGMASARINLKILPLIIIPLSIILCYLFIFKETEQPSRTIFSVLLGCCLISPFLWYIAVKIVNYYYLGKINNNTKKIKKLSGI